MAALKRRRRQSCCLLQLRKSTLKVCCVRCSSPATASCQRFSTLNLMLSRCLLPGGGSGQACAVVPAVCDSECDWAAQDRQEARQVRAERRRQAVCPGTKSYLLGVQDVLPPFCGASTASIGTGMLHESILALLHSPPLAVSCCPSAYLADDSWHARQTCWDCRNKDLGAFLHSPLIDELRALEALSEAHHSGRISIDSSAGTSLRRAVPATATSASPQGGHLFLQQR